MPKPATRARQSVRFLSRLFRELGYNGWIVLLDEVELIRLQGPVSRGKGYAELAEWFGLGASEPNANLGVVATVTDDFVSAMIHGSAQSQNDAVYLAEKLSATPSNRHLAEPAAAFMNFLMAESGNQCEPHGVASLVRIQSKVQRQYETAYGCSVESLHIEEEQLRPIRVYIRRWIIQWDLMRLGRRDEIDERELRPQFEPIDDQDNDG